MTSPAKVGIIGQAPIVAVQPGNPEALKYGRLWAMPEYRKDSPGELLAQTFLAQARPRSGAEVIDFGCGTGRGALMLALLGNLKVTMVDFVRNSLDPEIQDALTTQAHALRFVKADLEQPLSVAAPYGFCIDVMEHIPPDRVDKVLNNILRAAQHVFFSIATVKDNCGALIGEQLHLTVESYTWWLRKLADRDCVIHWSAEEENRCLFYVSAWRPGREVVKSGVLNAEESKARENVAFNIAQGWEQIHPFPTNDTEVMILGGGPSMLEYEKEIRHRRLDGMPLITLNGAYNWALDHGLTPSAQVIVDIRPFNARFTKPVVDGCKYFIGSQCDPSVLEGLPKDRTYLFHTMAGLVKDLLDAHYGGTWHAVPGGSTVLLRAIPLFRMLGFRRFHLYGADSCLMGDEHHAYAQREKDGAHVLPVVTNPGGRIFYCHPWMISQAQEWLDLIRLYGDVVELAVYGDGLLAHILNTGASITTEEG
jgi:2-polyprenyl-3-methyl-5-hydroxy-6-metoxy-1,4-benzoquinol methylase